MFLKMIQRILESLLSLSSTMDLLLTIPLNLLAMEQCHTILCKMVMELHRVSHHPVMDHHLQPILLILIPMDLPLHHQVLMVVYRGSNLDILLLLLMGMLMPRTDNMDNNLLTHFNCNQSMIHLTNRCHPYSQQFLNLRWTQ